MKILNLKFLLSILILLIILQAGLIFVLFKSKQDNINEENLAIHYSYFSGIDFYEEAYEQTEGQIKYADKKIYGGILPHHLMVKDKIAAFFRGIEKYDYENIILIGPNHFSAGQSDIIISKAEWETPYGKLQPDLELVKNLNKLSSVDIEEDPFITEHSISGLVGFIKKSFPRAKFTPIIVRVDTSVQDATNLANAINKITNKNKTLVLASVDFSHYQPVNVADFHDLKSQSVIENFNFDNIYDLEIDSPTSIYVLLKHLEIIKSQKPELIFHTNSGELIGKLDEPTTSHNFYYFTEGERETKSLINFLFFGDIMLDRHVKEIMDKNKGIDYLLEQIAGVEKRFFQGNDIVMANLEGAVTANGEHYAPQNSIDFAFDKNDVARLANYQFNFFTISNNHILDQGLQGFSETQANLAELGFSYVGCADRKVDDCSFNIKEINDVKVGFLAYSMVYGILDEEKLLTQIKEVEKQVDLVIVNIHWGVEYEHIARSNQKNLAYKMIDAGADAIIGHHPHVVQNLEIYNNKPIFYSLGNFIFDQYFSNETQEGLAVGLTYESSKMQINLLPFYSEYSKVKLMTDKRKEEFLQWLKDISDVSDDFKKQIANGKINL